MVYHAYNMQCTYQVVMYHYSGIINVNLAYLHCDGRKKMLLLLAFEPISTKKKSVL